MATLPPSADPSAPSTHPGPRTAPQVDPEPTLRPGRIGVWGIVFFVVAAAAPLVGMTGALPPAIVLGTGAAAPGAYLTVGLTLLLFSVGYAAMGRRITHAGAFFAYIGRGLGPRLGVASAFVTLLAYLAVQLSLYGFFGGLMAAQLGALPWWGWAALAWAVVCALSLAQVDVGARLLGLLLVLELGALVLTALAILRSGGPQGIDLAASFSPSRVLAAGWTVRPASRWPSPSRPSSASRPAPSMAKKRPTRAAPCRAATYLSVGVITLLFALTAFAVVTGLGAGQAVDRVVALSSVNQVPLTDPAAVLFTLARQHVAAGWPR